MNLISFEFTPRSEISGSYSSSSLKIFRTIHTVLHKDCTNLHLYQECRRILISPHCQHLLPLVSLIIANLTGKQWYFIVVLVFISLMISDIEHLWYACWLFVCLLWKMSIHVLCLFLNTIFIVVELYEFLIYFIYYQIHGLEIFLPFHRWPFHFVGYFLCHVEAY